MSDLRFHSFTFYFLKIFISLLFNNMSIRNLFSLSVRPSQIPVSAAQASENPGWEHYLPGLLEVPDLHSSEASQNCTTVSNHQ